MLDLYMNNYFVGTLGCTKAGIHQFQYAANWLAMPGARPISCSMPLRKRAYQGNNVYYFFDNLLPDNSELKHRLTTQLQAKSSQPYDLISKIKQDYVGALQFVPHGATPINIKRIESTPLSNSELAKYLTHYQAVSPLKTHSEQQCIGAAIAGTQEKITLLRHGSEWHLPLNSTPSSHIIKLSKSNIPTASHCCISDITHSIENEYLCLKIAAAFGLPVPECSIITAGSTHALAVARFDRRHAKAGDWIMRIPQEDLCQVFGIPPEKRYQNHGGPSIKMIMSLLLGSANADLDRVNFMKVMVLFWLLGMIEGHGKNFSIFLGPDGSYQLTPFYDMVSIYPAIARKQLHMREATLAMALKGPTGEAQHINQIYPHHFIHTAKFVGFDPAVMKEIMLDMHALVDTVVPQVASELPEHFPQWVKDPILRGLKAKASRLTPLRSALAIPV